MNSSFSFSKNTVGFFIEGGVFDQDRFEELADQIRAKIDRYKIINLYLEDQGIESFTIPAISKKILFEHKFKDNLNKVALVTDRRWIKACAAVQDLYMPTTIKTFAVEDRIDAMSWIAQQ